MAALPQRNRSTNAGHRGEAREECRFRFLDVVARVTTPPTVLLPIRTAFRRFVATDDETAAHLELMLDAEDSAVVHIDGRPVPLPYDGDTAQQVYGLLVSSVFDRVAGHAMLHAAALADGDRGALLLAGSSGLGKTSLTLELAARGMGFLSDDHAPLDLASREVTPYPRTVGVLPWGHAPLPERFRAAAVGTPVSLFGKSLIDVGDVLGEQAIVSHPVPLRHVVVVSGSPPEDSEPPATTILELVCRADAGERVGRRLAAIRGLDVLGQRDARGTTIWAVRLRHESRPTSRLSEVLEDDAVLATQKFWDAPPAFDVEPQVAPLRRRQAAEFLGREMLNRRNGSRFLRRHGGSVTAFFVDLAGALRDAECWKLTPGRFHETVELVQRVMAEGR